MEPALKGCGILSLVRQHFVATVHAGAVIAVAMTSKTTLEWLGGLRLITMVSVGAHIPYFGGISKCLPRPPPTAR